MAQARPMEIKINVCVHDFDDVEEMPGDVWHLFEVDGDIFKITFPEGTPLNMLAGMRIEKMRSEG